MMQVKKTRNSLFGAQVLPSKSSRWQDTTDLITQLLDDTITSQGSEIGMWANQQFYFNSHVSYHNFMKRSFNFNLQFCFLIMRTYPKYVFVTVSHNIVS